MTKPTYMFTPSTISSLLGEQAIDELLTEYQELTKQYLTIPEPILGEAINETFYRTTHSLKAASLYIGADCIAEEAQALEAACKVSAVCNVEIHRMAVDLQLQLKEINTQITHYLRSR